MSRSDHSALSEVLQRGPHQSVARVLPGRVRRQDQSLGVLGGEVLERVNGQVDAALEQGRLELGGEQALAPHLGQRSILDQVAAGLEDLQPHRDAVELLQGLGDVAGLRQGQLAAPGAQDQLRDAHTSSMFGPEPYSSLSSKASPSWRSPSSSPVAARLRACRSTLCSERFIIERVIASTT
jgi:hypothetical protein